MKEGTPSPRWGDIAPPGQAWPGGVAAPVGRKCEASEAAQTGGGSGSKIFPFDIEPPPRPLHQRKLRDIFLDVASTPPGQEGRSIASDLANELPTQQLQDLRKLLGSTLPHHFIHRLHDLLPIGLGEVIAVGTVRRTVRLC